MDIKKTVTIEGVRSWTGPIENYEAHNECVEHWCGGGDVEFRKDNTDWDSIHPGAKAVFVPRFEYRIKSREPNFGEVWIVGDIPCIYSAHCVENFRFIQLNGANAHNLNASPVYAASSVEAYIAKKFIDELGNDALIAYEFLSEKAGEE